MKSNFTYIVFVLDESGSMSSIKSSTIEAYNSFRKLQVELPGEVEFRLMTFNSGYRYKNHCEYLNNDNYRPSGGTALYHSLGHAIEDTGILLSHMKEEERPDKVLVVVVTDGEDNVAGDFNPEEVRQMIEHQSEVYKWKFLYLGANHDAFTTAASIGIDKSSAMNYFADDAGMKGISRSLSSYTEGYRSGNAPVSLEAA